MKFFHPPSISCTKRIKSVKKPTRKIIQNMNQSFRDSIIQPSKSRGNRKIIFSPREDAWKAVPTFLVLPLGIYYARIESEKGEKNSMLRLSHKKVRFLTFFVQKNTSEYDVYSRNLHWSLKERKFGNNKSPRWVKRKEKEEASVAATVVDLFIVNQCSLSHLLSCPTR